MARRDSDTIFHVVNFNIQNVLQDGLAEIRKLQLDKNYVSDQSFTFLRYMTFLVDHAIKRTQTTSKAEEIRQSHYRKLRRNNYKILKKISALSKTLENQRNLRRRIEERIHSQHIKNIELVEKIEKKFIKDSKGVSKKFERMQIDEYKKSEARQNDLKPILNITQNKLQNLLMTNERLEKDIYSKRYKVTSQYLSLLNRYDTEIGERLAIITKLKAEFDALSEERRELEDAIEKQSETFNSCIYVIRSKKIKEFTNRVKLSRRINAAKIIQKWWRLIIDKRKTKKKRKITKKKKKKKKRRKVSP